MKALLAFCMMVVSAFSFAAEAPAAGAPAAPDVVVTGEVLEVKNVESYTYLRLKTKDGEIWAAVIKASVKKGATVTVENGVVMNNFQSKALKRTFPAIVFGNLSGSAAASAPAGHGRSTAYPLVPGKKKLDTINDEQVAKASGANAKTVAEINSQRAELKDKTVLVRGKVVKYNAEIMGKNWIHLRDGSGSPADDTNDILVTTSGQAKVGDIVTVKGTVRTDRDFGAGYAYRVLIEDAALQ